MNSLIRRRLNPSAQRTSSEVKRFEQRIRPGDGECWLWVGATNGSEQPYGVMCRADRSSTYAHRWSYEHHVAAIPDGLQIDHLCRNTLCVNPWHLEPVTPWVNTMRSTSLSSRRAQVTECPKGHPYDDENTYWRPLRNGHKGRGCRTCRADADRRRHERRMAERRAAA